MASVKNVGGTGIGIWIWISVQLFLLQVAKCTPNTSITFWRCNENDYSPTDPYADDVDNLFADLMNATPAEEYDYRNHWPVTSPPVVYGHATCALGISLSDCTDCLKAVAAAVRNICPFKIGGTVEMEDCSIRYENYQF